MTQDVEPQATLVYEIIPASELGVGDIVPEHGLVVSVIPTDPKTWVGYGSLVTGEPVVEKEVDYGPDDMVRRVAVSR